MAGASAIARHAFADARVRTVSFALLFLVAALTQATAYRKGYPTLADRLKFAPTRAALHGERSRRVVAFMRGSLERDLVAGSD